MLHRETVEPGTLSLLKELMEIEPLSDFALVGGTALSLKHGHRSSVDLDLFLNKQFDHNLITASLKRQFGKGYAVESKNVKWGIFCYVNNIKVDIVYYKHPLIQEIEIVEGIRMYSDNDIAAMKINAILGRGTKKDFWDLHELLQKFSLAEIISFHEKKFPEQNLLITIPQAIVYFDDADETNPPVSFKHQKWEVIKKDIQKKVREFLK